MLIDSTTFRDLQVVPTPPHRGPTLWALLNRTRTRAGGAALRARLLEPPHRATDILALQHAHQHLAAAADDYRLVLGRTATDLVEQYLNATWQRPDEMPPLSRVRSWYHEYVRDVERGQVVVASLFDALDELRQRLSGTDTTILNEIGHAMADGLAAGPIQALRGALGARTPAGLTHFDALARGPAKTELERLLMSVGCLEALWSIGVATSEHGWTYPRPSTRMRLDGLYHPFIGPSAVASNLHLDDQTRVCFVTGPNMAGKSTFLRAIGLAVLLAHLGAGVPAASMEFVPAGTLFTSIELADDLTAGQSFYLAEVRRIGALADALSDWGSALAIIDEPFRGTNVHDAAEATLAIMTRLAAHPAALTFVASHLAEVVPTIRADPRIAFRYFGADTMAEPPGFDYRLRTGVSEQRLGMTLLRQEGVLDRLEGSTKPRQT
jgi:DNA mismatch repair ATPase MutS